MSTHHNAVEVSRGACCRTLLLVEDVLFEVVPGISQVPGLRHFGESRLARRSRGLSGKASDLRKLDVPQRGTP